MSPAFSISSTLSTANVGLSNISSWLPFEPRAKHLVLAFVGISFYWVVHRLFIYPFLLSPLRHVPGPPLGHLIYGQSRTIINSESGIPQREWAKKYGPVVRVVGPIGLERLIFLRPEALHQILVKDWLEYPRPGFLRNILGLVAGYGLLTVTGDEHKQMRKAMNPAFSIPNLMAQTRMYHGAIEGLVDIFNTQIDQEPDPTRGKEIRVYEWMSKVTLDIICSTAFGYLTDSLHNPTNSLASSYSHLVSLQSGPNIAKLALTMVIPGAPKLLLSDFAYRHRKWFTKLDFFAPLAVVLEAMYAIKGISRGMLRVKMREVEEEGVVVEGDEDVAGKKDVMSLLVRARMREVGGGYRMSDKAMMDQVLTFLGAGHETTASGLAWTLWLLANDIPSQRKLREEVRGVFVRNPRPDYKTLRDLKWLDCIVMESLRVMPPVPLTVRKATKTGYIDGVLVPKGTLLWIAIRVVNTWKEIWGDDAEEFHPERWLNLPKSYHPSFSLLSFIAGPHACIGKTMAIVEMKAVIFALIANFEFEPAYEGQKAKPAAAITMKPEDGMPLRVRRV